MKTFKGLFIGIILILLTGCVDYGVVMDIKKDKSMFFTVIATCQSDGCGSGSLLEDEEKKDYEEKGYTVVDFYDNDQLGVKLTKKVLNIDSMSSTKKFAVDYYDFLSDETNSQPIFTIKKGFFKNTYKANITMPDSNDSLSVILPFSAKSNNATVAKDKNRSLTWYAAESSNATFEFKLYNNAFYNMLLALIIIDVVGILLMIVCIIKSKNHANVDEEAKVKSSIIGLFSDTSIGYKIFIIIMLVIQLVSFLLAYCGPLRISSLRSSVLDNNTLNNNTVKNNDNSTVKTNTDGISVKFDELANDLCLNNYDVIYQNDSLRGKGIVECLDNHYVYYIDSTGVNDTGELYEFGYVKHDDVEEFFPGGIYFYRISNIGYNNELKIALSADSEDDLVERYSKKLYDFVKYLNSKYECKTELVVYYNKSFSDVKTTYDKLFLNSAFRINNVTQFGNSGRQHTHTFYDGDPFDLLQTIFSEREKYSESGRTALKFNRHAIFVVEEDVHTMDLDTFTARFKESFHIEYDYGY